LNINAQDLEEVKQVVYDKLIAARFRRENLRWKSSEYEAYYDGRIAMCQEILEEFEEDE